MKFIKLNGIRIISIIIVFMCICAFDTPASTVIHDRHYYEQRGEVIWEVPIDKKWIALTFDDGPDPVLTPQILDLLQQYDAKATFFIVGNRIQRYKDIIQRELAEGHEIGNHTYNHIFFDKRVNSNQIKQEINKTKKEFTTILDIDGSWFRPPGGYYNDAVIAAAKENGYTVVLWSWHQDTEDWQSPGVNKIVNKVLNNARNGDIILMHDYVKGSTQTVEALKIILPQLKKRGFECVTVSELVQNQYFDEMSDMLK